MDVGPPRLFGLSAIVSVSYFLATHNIVASPLLALLHLQGWPI
jgi:hypothetical protein